MTYYVTDEIEVVDRIHRVGNSLAILIPAKVARRAHLREGDPVRAHLSAELPSPYGLLRGKVSGPFIRKKEGLWRDR